MRRCAALLAAKNKMGPPSRQTCVSPPRSLRALYMPLRRGIYRTLRSLGGETPVWQGVGPAWPPAASGPFGPRLFRVGSVCQWEWLALKHTVTIQRLTWDGTDRMPRVVRYILAFSFCLVYEPLHILHPRPQGPCLACRRRLFYPWTEFNECGFRVFRRVDQFSFLFLHTIVTSLRDTSERLLTCPGIIPFNVPIKHRLLRPTQ